MRSSRKQEQMSKEPKFDHYYLGLRPTVNTALIPICHTHFKNKMNINHMCAQESITHT
jgi:hypothetical protein